MANPIASGPTPQGGVQIPQPNHNPSQAGTGAAVVGRSVQQVGPTDYVPGMGGLLHGPGAQPGGAVAFNQFMSTNAKRSVPQPMDRPVMLELRARAEAWFSKYLEQARGSALQANEEIPALLLLVMALYQTREPQRNRCLQCMKALTIPISTSNTVTVRWEHQRFTAVPYAVQHFPLGVAISILERCRTNIFDELKLLWDQERKQHRMRALNPQERTIVSFMAWRDPTPQEEAAMKSDYGISPGTMVAMDGDASLMFSFNPNHTLDEVRGVQQPSQQPHSAGSSHPSQDPGAPAHAAAQTSAAQGTPPAPAPVPPAAQPGVPDPAAPAGIVPPPAAPGG